MRVRNQNGDPPNRINLLWGCLWLAAAFLLQYSSGSWNPLQGLSLVWEGRHTNGTLVDSYEELVDSSDGRDGGITTISIYEYSVDGRKFTISTNSSQARQIEQIKYLPDNPSLAAVEGPQSRAEREILADVLLRVPVLAFLLYMSLVSCISGFIGNFKKPSRS